MPLPPCVLGGVNFNFLLFEFFPLPVDGLDTGWISGKSRQAALTVVFILISLLQVLV